MTDPTGLGDFHGDVDSVRRHNREDPAAKRAGALAVRRGAAASNGRAAATHASAATASAAS
jgi:hypothetical protein